MKVKNIIVCSILALTLYSSVNAESISPSMRNDALKQDTEKLTTLLSGKVVPVNSESEISPAMKLIEAIQRRDRESIDMILDSLGKFNVDEQDELGYTALMWAIKISGMKSVSRRLAYYSDLTVKDLKGRNALMWALKERRDETADEIIDILLWHEDYKEFNVQDEEGKTALMYAVTEHNTGIVGRLFDIKDEEGNYVVILNPLELDKYPRNGEHPMIDSVCTDGGQMLKMFINARDKQGNFRLDLNYTDGFGYTALSKASRCSLKDVKIILEAKDDEGNYRMTNLNSSRFEENPLMQATVTKHMDISSFLLEVKDDEGNYRIDSYTPLDRDVKYRISENKTVEFTKGDMAFDIAIKIHEEQIAAYLFLISQIRKQDFR